MNEFESYNSYLSSKTGDANSSEFESYDAYEKNSTQTDEFESYDSYLTSKKETVQADAQINTNDQSGDVVESLPILDENSTTQVREDVTQPAVIVASEEEKPVVEKLIQPSQTFYDRLVKSNYLGDFGMTHVDSPTDTEVDNTQQVEVGKLKSVLDKDGNVSEEAIRRDTFAAYERGEFSKIKDSKWGVLNGLASAATGGVGFTAGFLKATADIPGKVFKEKLETGELDETGLAKVLNEVNQTKDHIAEALTYMPENVHGKKIAEFVAAPFAAAHKYLEDKLADQSEDVRGAAHYLLDAAFVTAPMGAKKMFDIGKRGVENISTRKPITIKEAAAVEVATPERLVREDIAKVDENIKKAKVDHEEAIVKKNETIDDVLGDELNHEPSFEELSKEEKLLAEDINTTIATEDRIAELERIHAEWKKKKAFADEEVAESLGFDIDETTNKNYLKSEGSKSQTIDASIAVKPINDRLASSPLYTDAKITTDRAELYAKGAAKQSISNDPTVALQELINRTNRYIHGDESINLSSVSETLKMFSDNVDSLRSYFVGDSEFSSFKSMLDDAFVFNETAKGKEVVIDSGIKLSSGIDPVEFFKTVKEGIKFLEPKLDKAARHWWDTTARLKKRLDQLNTEESYNVYKNLVLRQGANSRATHHIELVRKAVFDGTGGSARKLIDDIMYYRRVAAIDLVRFKEAMNTGRVRKVTHPILTKAQARRAGLPGVPKTTDIKTARAALAGIRAKLGEKKFNELNSRVDIAFGAMRDTLKMLKDEGIISTKLYNKLKDVEYLPRRELIAAIDPVMEYKIGKIPLSIRDSGVTSLKKGTPLDKLEMDSELLLADVIQSAYGRVFRNRTNKALFDLALNTPDNGIAKIPKPSKDGSMPKAPQGYSRIMLFADGKKRAIFLKNDFAKDWLAMDREISFDMLRKIQLVSGAAVVRVTATGLSNSFALVNAVKDPLHIYFTNQVKIGDKWTSVYSSNPIKFVAQYGQDAASLASDVVLKKGEYIDAQMDGALMTLKAQEGQVFRRSRNLRGPVDNALAVLGAIPERSELIGRLSVRKRAMRMKAKQLGLDWNEFESANAKLRPIEKNGRLKANPKAKEVTKELANQVMEIRREGSFASRDYMDYSNHGTYSEVVNAGVAFFGAGIQGTRGLIRAAVRDPKEFTKKLAWLGATVAGINLYNKTQHSDKMDKVSKYARLHNFIIMTDWKFVDENGDVRNVYVKIPKDNSQIYYSGIVEAGMDKYILGQEDVDLPGVAEGIKSFSPIDTAVPNVPTIDLLLGTTTNFDLKRSLWEGKTRQVWNGPETSEVNKYQEFDTYTPQWAIGLGKMFNVSPAQMKHGVDAYFARNEWTTLSGKFFDKMFGQGNQELHEIVLADALTKYPMSRRFFGATMTESEKTKEADMKDISAAALESFIIRRELRTLIKDTLVNGDGKLNELFKYKADHPKHKDSIQDEIDFALDLRKYGVGYRKFWLRMRGPARIEAKANMYARRYDAASGDDKILLDYHRRKFGYDTQKFNQALMDVRVREQTMNKNYLKNNNDGVLKQDQQQVKTGNINSIIDKHAKRLKVSSMSAEDNLLTFAKLVGKIENNDKVTGNNTTSTAKGLYQYVDNSIAPAVNRLERLIGKHTWTEQLRETKDANTLTRQQQTELFLADMLERKGSDKYMKKVMQGDKQAMLDAYLKLHHTAPDKATIRRAKRIIGIS